MRCQSLAMVWVAMAPLCLGTPAQAAEPPISSTFIPGLFQPVNEQSSDGIRLQLDLKSLSDLKTVTGPVDLQLPIKADRSLPLKLERFEVVTPASKFIRATSAGQVARATPQIILL